MERNFYDLPAWDDERHQSFQEEDDNSESWKPNPTRDACKAMCEQWRHVFFLLNSVLADLNLDDVEEMERGFIRGHAEMMLGDAHLIAVKIRSSEVTGMYVTRMENASIIRTHAQGIASGLLSLGEDGIDRNHVKVIREEINKFRCLFKAWVNSFVKDEFEDEWGLFM